MSTSTDHHEEEDVPAGEDEDTGAQVAPIVRLEEVAVSTGEEDEEVILDLSNPPGVGATSCDGLVHIGISFVASLGAPLVEGGIGSLD
ncbi:hypothetical protein TSUD_289210 [Trifolium subterraneum]|uniref:Uncharacterized protein n=1 Tax=Trifolium subterraneum TaxID=3900 RepID=A0A2Z6NBV9_TRISU|nr:hypothetical protein TSUD_289210 [Trifolium subterraneum]